MLNTELSCVKDPDTFTEASDKKSIRQNKAMAWCAACTEQPTCLLQTLEFEQLSGDLLPGVAGGMTRTQRASLTDQSRRALINKIEEKIAS